MFLITITAYADFDIPYEVPLLVTKYFDKANKIVNVLNGFLNKYVPQDGEDKELSKVLEEEITAKELYNVVRSDFGEKSTVKIICHLKAAYMANLVFLYNNIIKISEVERI